MIHDAIVETKKLCKTGTLLDDALKVISAALLHPCSNHKPSSLGKTNCQQCDKEFKKKTYHHKFCCLKCKDHFHNVHNPRGQFAYLNPHRPEYDLQRIVEESMHPYDLGDVGDKV